MEDMKKTFEEKLKEAEQKGVILNISTYSSHKIVRQLHVFCNTDIF